MASSSHNTFDGSMDDAFDQYYDQAFENFSINIADQGKKKKTPRAYIEGNREEGDLRLWHDYFSDTPTYPPNLFRRRFRMNKHLFMHIVHRLSNEVQFF